MVSSAELLNGAAVHMARTFVIAVKTIPARHMKNTRVNPHMTRAVVRPRLLVRRLACPTRTEERAVLVVNWRQVRLT